LWRIRGSIKVPLEADDEGLLSRVAHILEQQGATAVEERHDWMLFIHREGMWGRLAPRFPWLFDRMEVSRYGIRGWRTLLYDRSVPQLLAAEAVFTGTFVAGLLTKWGGLTIALPATVLICLAWYGFTWWNVRKATLKLLRRAFET
jgi:hypothetical protein